VSEFNVQDQFIRMLQDQHLELLNRQERLYRESRDLSMKIRNFEYLFAETKKLLGKEAKEKLRGIWTLTDDKDVYQRLKELTTTYKGEEMPIFSEGYLYETIGKSDARAVLALLNSIYDAAGKPADF
jgi:hypothetical protein